MAIGAISFCVPDIAWHAIRGSQFEGWDAIGLTVVLPLSFLGTYRLVKRSQGNEREKTTILRWMLLCLWLPGGFLLVLGGFLIMVGASFAGAGFDSSSLQMVPISLIPGIVYILAAYDGSLGALIIVTLTSLIIWFSRAIRQPSKSL
jgi:hypothetical protein